MIAMVHTNFQDNQQKKKGQNMLNKFQAYLVSKGYKEFSANSNPSTAIDYPWRISKIVEKEGITYLVRFKNI